MARLTEDDPITSPSFDWARYQENKEDPFTNYCPACEGTGYSNLDDVAENDYHGLEVCTRCHGSGELNVDLFEMMEASLEKARSSQINDELTDKIVRQRDLDYFGRGDGNRRK